MLDQLRRQCDIISLEAASGDAAVQKATGRLPGFVKAISDFFSRVFVSRTVKLPPARDLQLIHRRLHSVNYADIRHHAISVPAGLTGTLLNYVTALSAGATAMDQLERDVLVPFTKWLRIKLGNPSSLASLTNSLQIAGYVPHNTTDLSKKILACIAERVDGVSKVPYGQAFQRNEDWQALSALLPGLESSFSANHHERIKRHSAELSDLLDRLLTRIDDEPETYKLSSTTLKNLSETTLAVARELEFYGWLQTRVTELGLTLERAVAETQAAISR